MASSKVNEQAAQCIPSMTTLDSHTKGFRADGRLNADHSSGSSNKRKASAECGFRLFSWIKLGATSDEDSRGNAADKARQEEEDMKGKVCSETPIKYLM